MDKPHPTSDQPEPLPDESALDEDGALTAQLVAYLDGELDPEECEEIESKINLDPKVRAKVEALKQTWALLDHLPRPEPSPRFTERTMEKIEPVPAPNSREGTNKNPVRRALATSSRSSSVSTPTLLTPTEPSAARRGLMLLGSFLVLGIAATAGYFIRAAVVPAQVVEKPPADPKIEDLHLLRNFRLYQHVNDVKFLKELDHPDFFGDGSIGS